LTDPELLAIFLRTGVAGKSAVDLARELLAEFRGLHGLFCADEASFCAAKGLGPAKFAQLRAVLEMSRRYLAEELAERDVLSSPKASLAGIARSRVNASAVNDLRACIVASYRGRRKIARAPGYSPLKEAGLLGHDSV
jgi:DNA repair protein RadC